MPHAARLYGAEPACRKRAVRCLRRLMYRRRTVAGAFLPGAVDPTPLMDKPRRGKRAAEALQVIPAHGPSNRKPSPGAPIGGRNAISILATPYSLSARYNTGKTRCECRVKTRLSLYVPSL